MHQEQITRVYHGLSVSTKPSSARPESIPEGWDGDFLFTCGSVRPARGLEDAVRVLAELKKYGHHPRLVIAGEIVPAMKAYHREITDWLVKHNLQQQVCWTGRLNQEQMNWCYQNTRLLIMTTRIEACPNIAIEALANGVNTISTNCPPMPEFFGDLVTYYTPGDTSLLAKGIMENLAFEPEQVRARSEAMRNQSRRFSWDKTAAQTLAVLKQALVDFRQTKERNL